MKTLGSTVWPTRNSICDLPRFRAKPDREKSSSSLPETNPFAFPVPKVSTDNSANLTTDRKFNNRLISPEGEIADNLFHSDSTKQIRSIQQQQVRRNQTLRTTTEALLIPSSTQSTMHCRIFPSASRGRHASLFTFTSWIEKGNNSGHFSIGVSHQRESQTGTEK